MAKGPFMEYLKAVVQMSIADTFAQTALPTPTSKTENMAMLIHSISMQPTRHTAIAPANEDSIQVMVASKSQTAWLDRGYPDIMAACSINTILAAVMNQIVQIGELEYKFDPPILYPKAHIYCGISSAGIGLATLAAHFNIGYTLEKVSREDFISALVE